MTAAVLCSGTVSYTHLDVYKRQGHAHAQYELPGVALLAQPAREPEQAGGDHAAHQQRRAQREPGGDRALAAMLPRLAQVQFDACLLYRPRRV